MYLCNIKHDKEIEQQHGFALTFISNQLTQFHSSNNQDYIFGIVT